MQSVESDGESKKKVRAGVSVHVGGDGSGCVNVIKDVCVGRRED